MRHKHIIAALGAIAIAAPALASNAAGAASAAAKGQSKAAAAQEKKYCIAYDNVVGSRVTRQECRTKAEWRKEGVDVDRLLSE